VWLELEALRSDKRIIFFIRLGYILAINMDFFYLLWSYTWYYLDLGSVSTMAGFLSIRVNFDLISNETITILYALVGTGCG
jgi:hypothetical protein